MKRIIIFLFLCSIINVPLYAEIPDQSRAHKEKAVVNQVTRKFSKLQIPFVTNQGQTHQEIRFYAEALGGRLFITRKGDLVYTIPYLEEENSSNVLVFKEELLGKKVSEVTGEEQTSTRVNYFLGNDRSKWRSSIATYDTVSFGELYSGVELRLKAHSGTVEKLFFVKPGAKAENIRIGLKGGKPILNKNGELEVHLKGKIVKFTKPVAYQESKGEREFVSVAYVLKGHEYGFKVGDYDPTRELVIDPLLAATFLGGGFVDQVESIALGADQNVYVAGRTFSPDFPGVDVNSADPTIGNDEGFVAKLNPDLSAILSATFLGGSGAEFMEDLVLDSAGNVYVTGGTGSSSFPGIGATSADSSFVGVGESFVVKLDSDLSTILAATFLGGSEFETASALSLDTLGQVHVVGTTESADFPGIGAGSADNTFVGEFEMFAAKLDSNLSLILGATFLGGSVDDGSFLSGNVVVSSDGSIYVSGDTDSLDFPGIGAGSADNTISAREAFVVRLSSNLGSILGATFLGGSMNENSGKSVILLDNLGNVFVLGDTLSSDFPGVNAGSADPDRAGNELFLVKLDSNLNSILAATFLGGSGEESIHLDMVLDGTTSVFIASQTTSPDFPGVGPGSTDDTFGGLSEAFVAKLDQDLSTILAATFLGGSEFDLASSIVLDGAGNVYVAGGTNSSDFPGINAGSADSIQESTEGFIAKLDSELSDNPPDCSLAVPSVSQLWPPNHKMKSVQVLGVTDPDGDPITVTIDSIFQDEAVNAPGSGNTCPDASGLGTGTAKVRAERAGNGDGRVYHIGFTASDGAGPACSGEVTVCVPHDQGGGNFCVDQGPLFNSTVCP